MPKKAMNSEISRSSIKEYIKMQLWGKAAGRCEMCNRILYQDLSFGIDGNYAENAHIHAVSEGGPRHKKDLSEEDKNQIENLMLLCQEHHHMIDATPENFTDGVLLKIKENHEKRIAGLSEIKDSQSSRIVTYFSNIDYQQIIHDESLFKQALVALNLFPMQYPVIKLHAQTDTNYEATKENYIQKAQELKQSFKIWFSDIVEIGEAISVFSLAPQPLLIVLGTLINDQYNTRVFQCHREGHKWAWKNPTVDIVFVKTNTLTTELNDEVALVVDLSAGVTDDRITSALNKEIPIFHITIDNPNRNFVRTPKIQDDFVVVFRNVMEEIKNLRPSVKRILLFPVMPNSLAVKLGMDYMQKTDLPMTIYDEDKINGGFFETITIGGETNA